MPGAVGGHLPYLPLLSRGSELGQLEHAGILPGLLAALQAKRGVAGSSVLRLARPCGLPSEGQALGSVGALPWAALCLVFRTALTLQDRRPGSRTLSVKKQRRYKVSGGLTKLRPMKGSSHRPDLAARFSSPCSSKRKGRSAALRPLSNPSIFSAGFVFADWIFWAAEVWLRERGACRLTPWPVTGLL